MGRPRGIRIASVRPPAAHRAPASGGASLGDGRPRWNDVLRSLRAARGATQAGWAARLGVSRATVQRWERGERAPDPGAEAAILAYCREAGLLRPFDRGPLAGLTLTAERLQELCAEARWRVSAGPASGPAPALPDRRSGSPPPDAAPQNAPAARHPPDAPGQALAVPTNLPAPLTSFVGREWELAAVRRVQAGTRLLTLTGPGGGGKTRLALALAEELLWAYAHGVWLVNLASVTDPALVPRVVASALGLRPAGPPVPLTAALAAALRERQLLLVLDNCEQLLPACAVVVEALLLACPHLEIVATSREPLGVSGEVVWRVPPLSVPECGRPGASGDQRTARHGGEADAAALLRYDAVRLFVERARLQRPDFTLTAGNAPAVAEICRRLDGIPLAIELAAARLSVLSVPQIAARLHDRFRLLTGGGRTALPRHQTLRAALDWSHDLLFAAEQALLRRLAVFAGGFTLEAAEAVCASGADDRPPTTDDRSTRHDPAVGGRPPSVIAEHDVLDLLAQLVGKSLVLAEEHGGAVRYRLLETVRQYAEEQLDQAGEAAAVRARHLDWCLALAQEANAAYGGRHEPAWRAR